jgi:putative aldouronate transport system permease protein
MKSPTSTKLFDIAFDVVVYVVMVGVLVVTLYPFLNILAVSFNESSDAMKGGIYLWPRKFSLLNYHELITYGNLFHSFFISVMRTVIGTLTAIVSTCMLAFVLSRKEFVYRRFFTAIFVLTLYISGGLIPGYMLLRSLGLLNKFAVYIWPALIHCWNVIVIRSYIEGIPFSLQESAKIDGANDLRIFARIIMPLCLPVIATISLFIAVGQWNSWVDTYLYASSRKDLSTLQFELVRIMQNATAAQTNASVLSQNSLAAGQRVFPQSLRMAITIMATVPIILVYPFIQRFFVKGLTLGGVKA